MYKWHRGQRNELDDSTGAPSVKSRPWETLWFLKQMDFKGKKREAEGELRD